MIMKIGGKLGICGEAKIVWIKREIKTEMDDESMSQTWKMVTIGNNILED